jgi:hypothetical protein
MTSSNLEVPSIGTRTSTNVLLACSECQPVRTFQSESALEQHMRAKHTLSAGVPRPAWSAAAAAAAAEAAATEAAAATTATENAAIVTETANSLTTASTESGQRQLQSQPQTLRDENVGVREEETVAVDCCELCGRALDAALVLGYPNGLSLAMTAHMRELRPDPDPEPLPCPLCDREFKDERSRTQHLASKHHASNRLAAAAAAAAAAASTGTSSSFVDDTILGT